MSLTSSLGFATPPAQWYHTVQGSRGGWKGGGAGWACWGVGRKLRSGREEAEALVMDIRRGEVGLSLGSWWMGWSGVGGAELSELLSVCCESEAESRSSFSSSESMRGRCSLGMSSWSAMC